jgi:hypothetical protein
LPDIIHRGRAFSENTRRLYPIAWCVAGSALFENEKARNEHRVWLGAGSAETIEKFLAEYYFWPSITVFRCPTTFFLTIWISGKQFRFRGLGPAKSRSAATYLRGDGTAKDEDTGIRILLPLINAAHAPALVC